MLIPVGQWLYWVVLVFQLPPVTLGEHSPEQSQTTAGSEKALPKPQTAKGRSFAEFQHNSGQTYLVPQHGRLLTGCFVIFNIRTGDCLSLSDFWFLQISDLAVVAKPRFILSYSQGHGHLHAIGWISAGREMCFHLSYLLLTTFASAEWVCLLSSHLHKHFSDMQILTVVSVFWLCISSTEGNEKAHFWFPVKTPLEILLTSDLTQHSISFKLPSVQTQEPVGISNAGQDKQPNFLCVTHIPPLPPSGDFSPVHSATHLRRRVSGWMLKQIMQEALFSLKELLYKILQHMILWWVDLAQLPAIQPDALLLHPQIGQEGENKMKNLMSQDKDQGIA